VGDTPITNVRRISHLLDLEPVPSQVPQVTAPYTYIFYPQISPLRTAILFLVEWDLDSGSAGDVMGIAKRARTYLI